MAKNRFVRGSKLEDSTFRSVLRDFAFDETATAAAEASGVSLRTVNALFVRLRHWMIAETLHDPEAFRGTGKHLRRAVSLSSSAPLTSTSARPFIDREVLRLAAGPLLSRMVNRGLRIDHLLDHAFELLIKSNTQRDKRRSYTLSAGDPAKEAYEAWLARSLEAFREALIRIPEPLFFEEGFSSGVYRDLYDELRDRLFDRPL